ncbi:hypothetical protein [Photobacterium halotolerans]|uniref:DUF2306 domain-containing protein n=1 Tax=Photobacterium halotolerans TaxID=265726 RepID=A0A7X4WUE8_9GAMM|nr:hypothetical protein [Photobacterium halotolerans]NAW63696.1 hypothetical protein [Photobacterium halotolerans]NAW88899.1 hypothetical protein [Photobacterium halotolerans]
MDIFLLIHVVLSIIALIAGFVAMLSVLAAKHLKGWTTLFLLTTLATSLTGFILPADQLLPSHIIGLLSLLTLGLAIYAWYIKKLQLRWRATYAITATITLYFNTFVAVVQIFLKIPGLRALAPTQTELPFIMVQTLVFLLFVVIGLKATKRLPALPPTATKIRQRT